MIQNQSVPFLSVRPNVPASHDKSSGLCHGLRSDVMVWVSSIVVRRRLTDDALRLLGRETIFSVIRRGRRDSVVISQ